MFGKFVECTIEMFCSNYNFDDLELPSRVVNICIKGHQCTNPIEKLCYSCDFGDIRIHCGQNQLQVDNDYFPQCQECQNVDRVKRPAHNTDVIHLYAQEYM